MLQLLKYFLVDYTRWAFYSSCMSKIKGCYYKNTKQNEPAGQMDRRYHMTIANLC